MSDCLDCLEVNNECSGNCGDDYRDDPSDGYDYCPSPDSIQPLVFGGEI